VALQRVPEAGLEANAPDAIKAWRREKRPRFTGLTCHGLRRTAANLMREAGMPVELVAERLGHGDGGALLLRTYRHVHAGETRAALDAIGHGLRVAAL
jgi:integrase